MPTILASSIAVVFLDTGPLGFATQRFGVNANADGCRQWILALTKSGITVVVPEIADYEQRREMLRSGNMGGIDRLDAFGRETAQYLPITTPALREAARLWAALRNAGKPTASKDALDGDAILAGQVIVWCATHSVPLSAVAVATVNVSDLSRFTDDQGNSLRTATWQEIIL